MFPNNEFWQCPSYTWSSMVIGVMIGIVVYLSFLVNEKVGAVMAVVGSLVAFVWILRTVYLWFVPNEKCKTVGYPAGSYRNPFAKREPW